MNHSIERRNAEYAPLIEEFKLAISNIPFDGITCPHIPGIGKLYDMAKYKICFCGMETYGWTKLTDFMQYDSDKILSITDSFIDDCELLNCMGSKNATFFGFIATFISRFYNVDFNDIECNKYPFLLQSIIWANANSIDRYEVTSEWQGVEYSAWEKVKNASRRFDRLQHIINSCNPRVVLIFYKNVNTGDYLSENEMSDIFGIDERDKTKSLTITYRENQDTKYQYCYSRNTRTHIFILPHPTWMGLYSGIGFDKFINSILADFKNYNVWDTLPQSIEDWQLKKLENEIPYKYRLIASIAHGLTKEDALMTGVELQAIFNINGITTQYGTQYSTEGGRGIYKVISSAWNYYMYVKKDRQVAYEISRSFVKKNGEYAYE